MKEAFELVIRGMILFFFHQALNKIFCQKCLGKIVLPQEKWNEIFEKVVKEIERIGEELVEEQGCPACLESDPRRCFACLEESLQKYERKLMAYFRQVCREELLNFPECGFPCKACLHRLFE